MCRSGMINTPRLHYKIGSQEFKKSVASQSRVKHFCFEGKLLKTMGDLV